MNKNIGLGNDWLNKSKEILKVSHIIEKYFMNYLLKIERFNRYGRYFTCYGRATNKVLYLSSFPKSLNPLMAAQSK